MTNTGTLNHDWYRKSGKRKLDLAIGSLALLVFGPAILLVALMVRMVMGSPILFRQQRPGLHGAPFMMLKFRTMHDLRDECGSQLPDERRLTTVGRFLRATSLDELPELWNVLKGDMSLVGPRPLLVEYMRHYTPEQHRRHEVRPGMTGLAQISERNKTTWAKRFAHDLLYVDRCSLWTDLAILAKTPYAMLQGAGGTQAISRLGKYRGPVC